MTTNMRMPDNSDGALEPDQQPTLSLAVAGTMEIPGSEDGIRPPLLMLFMANGEIRWVKPPSDDRQESSE